MCTVAEDGVALLSFNRPEKLNALNYQLVNTLIAKLREIERDPSVRSVKPLTMTRRFALAVALIILASRSASTTSEPQRR
jgi:1,4-dihydroxy-2-naphthoyl-CoA synthase